MTAPRPVCVHCGKRYGTRVTTDETVRWPKGQHRPAYRGARIVVREESIPRSSDQGMQIATRWIWDGVSWSTPYKPFCTLRCALHYARAAYAKESK